MFREACVLSNVSSKKGLLRTLSLLSTIQSCDVREDTPPCAYRVRPGENRKCDLVDCLFCFFLVSFRVVFCSVFFPFLSKGWLDVNIRWVSSQNRLLKVECSDADVCLSLCLGTLGSSSIPHWFVWNLPLLKSDIVPAVTRPPWLVMLI